MLLMQPHLHSIISSSTTSPPPSLLSFNPTYLVSNHTLHSLTPHFPFSSPWLSPLSHSLRALSVLFHLLKFLVSSFQHVPFSPLHTAPLGFVFIWHLQGMNIRDEHLKVEGQESTLREFCSALTSFCFLVIWYLEVDDVKGLKTVSANFNLMKMFYQTIITYEYF